MGALEWLTAAASDRLQATFGMNAAYGAPALAGALLCALGFYWWRRWSRHRKATSLKVLVRSIFAKRIVLHPSSILDMKLWALNTLAFAGAYGMLGVSGLFWRGIGVAAMTGAFGAHQPTAWPLWAILAVATLLELLAYELAYWTGHYLFHAIPALWEFHKVHHSAEVMTTLTEMRTHPVEIISFMNLIGLATGLVFGVLTYTFGPGVRPFTLLNGNIVLMMFLITIGHLRHSHMWIPFTGLMGRLFQSPAHHQIHHSDDPKHFNTNLGFALAFWDWVFGTLYIPNEREPIRFGVGARHVDFTSVLKLYLLPFKRSAEALFGTPEPVTPAPVVAPAPAAAAPEPKKLAA